MEQIIPALKIGPQETWSHHRSGWAYAIQSLAPLHTSTGINFDGWLDGPMAGGKPIIKPFVGFFHNTLMHPEGLHPKYEGKSLHACLKSDAWRRSEPFCWGVFVLCEDMKNHIMNMTNCTCSVVKHPVEMCETKFSPETYENNPLVIHIGQWMRRFDSFARISCPQKKVAIGYREEQAGNNFVVLDMLSSANFDEIMSRSVVFLHLFDVAACNTILDCIARDTPVICNRLPAAEEYLGKDYPAFFRTLKEAEEILNDRDLIIETHQYLKKIDKTPFSRHSFLKGVSESEVCSKVRNAYPIRIF